MKKLDKYYKELGLPSESTFSEVRKAYHSLSMRYIPDINKSDINAQEKFKKIREAYFTIRDSIFQKKTDKVNRKSKDKNILQRYLFPEEDIITIPDDGINLDIMLEKYYEDIGRKSGFEFLPFISLKGGTGKSTVINNLAVVFSLVTRYIEKYMNKHSQKIELYDLDFGKPDQRFLLGVNPKFFLDDIMSKNSTINDLNKITVSTPLSNLFLLSIDPHRSSLSLFYKHKYKLMYILNESTAEMKLIDFSAGLSSDILFFLRNINQKVIVANAEKSSVEAVFKIIVTLIANHIDRAFNDDPQIKNFTEKLKRCRTLNYSLKDFKEDLIKLDKQRISPINISHFYHSYVIPIKKELGMNAKSLSDNNYQNLEKCLNFIEKEFEQRFIELKNNKKNKEKIENLKNIYSKFLKVKKNSDKYSNHTERISYVLGKHKIGILMNKADESVSVEIVENIRYFIRKLLGFSVSNLGHIDDYAHLRNISNLKVPFILLDPTGSPAMDFYRVADKMLCLDKNSTFKTITKQLDYISFLRKNWKKS